MSEEKAKEKKSILATLEEHPKAVFFTRLGLWFIFACALPIAFIVYRYDIFTNKSKINISGWGAIGIVIAIVFVIKLIVYLYKGMKPGLAKQCITGFVSIILPLLIVLIALKAIENNIKYFEQVLTCVTICEAIGIPLDPFPDWLEKRRVERGKEHAETITDVVLDKIKEKFGSKKEGE